MSLRVIYRGPVGAPTGYAQAAHDYIASLVAAGVEVCVEPLIDGDTDYLAGRYDQLIPLVHDAPPGWATHVIVHTVPVHAHEFVGDGTLLGAKARPEPGVKKVALTTWETETLPASHGESLNRSFDAIIVPCAHNVRACQRGGIPVEKLRVVGHAFDAAFWGAERPPRPTSQPYTFYTIGTWTSRKNLQGLLLAYFAEFAPDEPVVLKIVSPEYRMEDIRAVIDSMQLADTPPVEILGVWPKRLSDAELREIHRTSDCFVTTSRGEAWGLGAFEAMLVGNAVIAPRYGGFVDFLPGYKGWYPVNYVLTPALIPPVIKDGIDVGGVTIRPVTVAGPNGINYRQAWAEPSLWECKEWMREAWRMGPHVYDTTITRARYNHQAVGERLKFVLEGI